MNEVISTLIAGVLGLALGIVGVIAFRLSQNRSSKLPQVDEPVLPEGAAAVLSVIGRAFVILDDVDGVVRANPASYAYGLVRGHTLVHNELLSLVRQVRADGVIAESQYELQRSTLGAGQLIVHVRVAPLGDEYILLLADDRTEITRTEAMRNDFVANVSHELKTPVGAIGLLAEAITEAADDPKAVRRFSTRMDKESRRLAALVQDIIELSRLQASDAIVQGQEVNIDSVVAEAVDRSHLIAEEKGIAITVGGHLEEPILGDADLLMTAIRNLIDNAIRYSPENTTVGVGIRQRDGYAQISVTDQGPGISAEEQERVFERFYRVDSARSRQTGGTGLGLSIVKHVLANHGGEVSLWSQPGHGSTFTLRLPLADEEPATSNVLAGQTMKERTIETNASDREGGRR
ncbi:MULTISPECIES: cell wall metabolism sensor histidine kinase WalK [unclassified Glutamicibacter]|uniref:sensor histidine kinase n=1 Tax=unclassified Glutamicibacter TaxID=2627139 RepID=UPI000FA75444|nr:two-component system sensor histidine kinase SenX3 [Arthrobacter sp. JUb119]TDU19025.1 two-component system sensor histidine kinase SenX3 [Arthrobacter sp. JUb115]